MALALPGILCCVPVSTPNASVTSLKTVRRKLTMTGCRGKSNGAMLLFTGPASLPRKQSVTQKKNCKKKNRILRSDNCTACRWVFRISRDHEIFLCMCLCETTVWYDGFMTKTGRTATCTGFHKSGSCFWNHDSCLKTSIVKNLRAGILCSWLCNTVHWHHSYYY